MRKIGHSLLDLLLLILLLISNIYSQRLWEIPEAEYELQWFVKDTSVTALRQVILNKESAPHEYEGAARILAYFHENTEWQFLLENLNTRIDSSSEPNPFMFLYTQEMYLTDQIVKGYLGDRSAIPALDSLITITQFESTKLKAMRKLAEGGVLKPEYYQFIKNSYLDSTFKDKSEDCLVFYGKDSEYKEEVKSLLIQHVYKSHDLVEKSSTVRTLWVIEPMAAITLLNKLFESSTGKERLSYFYDLYTLDPEGQPARSIWAIPREPDEYIRSDYFPRFSSIKIGIFPRSYLTPEWINFVLNWRKQETSDLITVPLGWFLNDFKPLPADTSKPAINMIQELIQLVDTVYKYTWLGSKDFADMLKNNLMSAKTDFEQNQLLKCAKKVKSFQDIVDAEYQDSSSANSNFVTKEGWKFLFYNAQYILDKLPALK